MAVTFAKMTGFDWDLIHGPAGTLT